MKNIANKTHVSANRDNEHERTYKRSLTHVRLLPYVVY